MKLIEPPSPRRRPRQFLLNGLMLGTLMWAIAMASAQGGSLSRPAVGSCPIGAEGHGTLVGWITDSLGDPLPGVVITLKSAAGPIHSTGSDDFGEFRFEALEPGAYLLHAEMPGFEAIEKDDLRILDGSSGIIDLEMKIARPTGKSGSSDPIRGFQVVPLIKPLNPDDSSVSEPAEPQQPDALVTQDSITTPDSSETFLINGNINFGLQPGADGALPDFTNDEGFRGLQQRLGQDSLSRRSPFFQGGVSEAQARAKAASAGGKGTPATTVRKAVRQVAGKQAAGAKRAAPRGRANRTQGQAFFNLGNSVLDARPYALTGVEHDKPAYGHYRFGATIGGPIRFPGAPKTSQPPIYLLNYTGMRGDTSRDSTSTVPIQEQRDGNFENSRLSNGQPVRIYDPLSATSANGLTQFPGNRIPASRMDPAAAALLRYIPLPNQPGGVHNYFLQRASPYSNDQFSARLNSRLGLKVAWNAGFTLNRNRTDLVGIFPSLKSSNRLLDQSVDLGGNYTLRKGVSNHLQLRFSRTRNESTNPYAYQTDIVGSLGLQGLSKNPANFGIPSIVFTNFGGLRLANPSLRRRQVLSMNDNFRIAGNRHSHQFGVELRHVSLRLLADENARGTFVFSGYATSNFDKSGNPIPKTGLDFADFLLGLPQSTSRRYGGGEVELRSNVVNAFYLDDWRAKPNLTLNLGLRYEFAQPPYEAQDRITNLDLPADISAAAQVTPGQTGPFTGRFPRSLIDPDRNNFAPRIGIAYRPLKRSNLVIRTGYGIFYNLGIYDQVAPKLADQPPFAVAQSLLTSATQTLTLQNGFPKDPDTTIRNTYAVDRHYRVGYVQSWNFNLQKELRRAWVLEAGYVGTKGTKLDLLRAPNRAPRGSSQDATEHRRLIGYAENFILETSGAASIYHSLQARVARRMSRGISVNANYIFGKSIDSASNIGGGTQLVVQDDNYLRGERGLSSFDVRHQLNLNYVVELPFGQGRRYLSQKNWLSQAFGNWTLAGAVVLSSGSPFTARTLGNAMNNSGTGGIQSERASATGLPVGLPSGERTPSRFFNTAAFQLPPTGSFGNAGRNTITGPGSALLNMTITHDIRIGEKGRFLSFVWNINNALNTPNYRAVGTVVNASSFGRITGVKPMRTMGMTLRLRF